MSTNRNKSDLKTRLLFLNILSLNVNRNHTETHARCQILDFGWGINEAWKNKRTCTLIPQIDYYPKIRQARLQSFRLFDSSTLQHRFLSLRGVKTGIGRGSRNGFLRMIYFKDHLVYSTCGVTKGFGKAL